jgi:hypothetical protein
MAFSQPTFKNPLQIVPSRAGGEGSTAFPNAVEELKAYP